MLPELSGVEVLEMLRTERKTAKTPVVVYTNYGDVRNREKCLTYGADEFILKVDSSPESLCQTINKLLTEREIEAI
jgi:CheY-like chemotaxis protein